MISDKLTLWQDRLAKQTAAYADELSRMERREALYSGAAEVMPVVAGDKTDKTAHVRNVVLELIESQTDSGIPQPKVTARRREDEAKAKLIEDMLSNELDRLQFERLNDELSRTVPIQGGGFVLVEWDNDKRTHTTVGELSVTLLHPRAVIPQDGIYTGVGDMDYIIVKLPQTKEYIKRKYKVDVSDEGESEPDVRGGDASDELVTQYIAYYRNDKGGIGLYSWVNDIELADYEDYQARRLGRCSACGGVGVDGKCDRCGGKVEESEEEYEELSVPVARSDGSTVGGMVPEIVIGEDGLPVETMVPVRVPYYKPDIYPVLLQKNTSVPDRFLGGSDVDAIEDQQNTINRVEQKILDKLLKSGSYMSLPNDAMIQNDSEEMKVIRVTNPADLSMMQTFTMQGDVRFDMEYLAQVYEEARQTIGITDSYQGRKDTTATSGVAKEFAANQSAGRLESKRVMKDAAWADLFETMFKFKLAYSDEPRPVVSKDTRGNPSYAEFNRFDFLEQDAAGEWFWNDMFLFSSDTTAALSNNREAMWQETRLNLQTGAFGDPAATPTLLLFWRKMEQLHYPGAAETRAYFEEVAEAERMAQMQAQQMQAQQLQVQQMQAETQSKQANVEETLKRVAAKAKSDAENTAKSIQGDSAKAFT